MNEQQRRDVVLVVDDSPDTLTLINDTLESSGMDVLLALDGKQALMIASRIRPDVILMDGVMPSLDGFEACKMLKADPTLNSIPVIFMTGLNDTHDIVRGLEVGGVDYLVKPVQPVELLARIKVHLRNARVSNTAQAALDHAGQHLMTVNVLGQITWATPQTHTLLSRANADMEWQRTQLAAQLRHWISQSPDSQMQLHLHGLACPVGLRMLGREPNGQCLIRLFDEGSTSLRVNNAALLKQELGLTERESEVLYWIANGKTNREVAEILGMSPRTVNKHLEQVFPKLGVENRTAAAGIALRLLEKELRQMTWSIASIRPYRNASGCPKIGMSYPFILFEGSYHEIKDSGLGACTGCKQHRSHLGTSRRHHQGGRASFTFRHHGDFRNYPERHRADDG